MSSEWSHESSVGVGTDGPAQVLRGAGPALGRCVLLPNPRPKALLLRVRPEDTGDLHARPTSDSHAVPQTLPPCHPKRGPLFGRPAPVEPLSTFYIMTLKIGLASPEPPTPPGPFNSGPNTNWILLSRPPPRPHLSKVDMHPSAKEAPCSPGAYDTSLPHLSSTVFVRLVIVCLFCPKR